MTLRAQVLTGMLWTGGTRLLSQILTWSITIVVIRILSPADYGLLAMATAFMTLFTLLAEAGLGSALVQVPKLDDLMLRRAFGAVILVNFALFALQFAAAPMVARFFGEERLIAVLRVLGLQLVIAALGTIPSALLYRKLDFKHQSLIGLAGGAVGSLTTLGMALGGHGVWALVLGSLVTQFVCMVILNIVSPYLKLPAFSLKGMRSLIVTGGQMTAARVFYFVYSQFDVFIAGKMLGKEMLGLYSTSLHLASLPVQRISSVVNQVAFPAFAEAQRRPETVPLYVLKVVRILSLFAFPVLWGISSIAPEVVTVLLGPKWHAASVPLQLLPLVMPITMISPFLNTAFQGIGRSGVVLLNAATMAVIMAIAFVVGTLGGLLGLSMAWLIGFPLAFWLNLRRMMPLIGLKPLDLAAAMAMPAVAATGMYLCVEAARFFAAGRFPAPLLMVLLVGAGAAGYVALAFLTNAKGIREVRDLFPAATGGGRST